MADFRNTAVFDASSLPLQVMHAIQPCSWGGKLVHLLLTQPATTPLSLWASSSTLERIPMLTIWDLYNDDDELCGYMFQTPKGVVSSTASHLLITSAALNRQFSVDDAQELGSVNRLLSIKDFNVYSYDIGATLVAIKALGFVSKLLDKDPK